MTMYIVKRFNFDSAHHLPGHPTCGEKHGHSFIVEIEISGEIDERGMLIDFSEVKRHVQPIIDTLDHRDLNTFMEYPTAENIILFILDRAKKRYPTISRIRLYETPNNYAEWRE